MLYLCTYYYFGLVETCQPISDLSEHMRSLELEDLEVIFVSWLFGSRVPGKMKLSVNYFREFKIFKMKDSRIQ